MLEYILLAFLAIAYFVFRKFTGDKKKKRKNVVDWFDVKNLTNEGMIITQDDRYLMMLKVQPIALALKSPMEQKTIWSVQREFLNVLTHPIRNKAESHPYDLEDYFQELKAEAILTEDMANVNYVEEQKKMFSNLIEVNKVQDRLYFIFLETSAQYLNEIAAETNIALLNSIFQKNGTNQGVDIDTVKQELTNTIRILQSSYHNVGIMTETMDRDAVLHYLYQTVNRDTANFLTFEDLAKRIADPEETSTSLTKQVYMGGRA